MDVLQAIRDRRAINFFDPERKIPLETLRDLLRVANLAPSSYNLQPWEVVAVIDPEQKKILRQNAYNQPKVEEAPVVLIVIANPNAVEENVARVVDDFIAKGYAQPAEREKQLKAPYGLYKDREHLARMVFAVKNTAFFAMAVMLAARGFGFEAHPMDGFKEEGVKRAFLIPHDRIIPLLIAIGYPKPGMSLGPPKFRRDIEEFVHYNTF